MKTALFVYPFYMIQACLSLPVSGEKNPRHLSDTKSVKTIWPVPRYHFVNDISEGNPKLIHDVRLEDTGALQYAKGLAVIRRKKRCTSFECFDAKATDVTTSTTTTTTPPPPTQPPTTPETTTTPTTKATTKAKPDTQSSDTGPTNSGSKMPFPFPGSNGKFPFPLPFPIPTFPRPKLPKFPWFG